MDYHRRGLPSKPCGMCLTEGCSTEDGQDSDQCEKTDVLSIPRRMVDPLIQGMLHSFRRGTQADDTASQAILVQQDRFGHLSTTNFKYVFQYVLSYTIISGGY